jgi:hypothetical protein
MTQADPSAHFAHRQAGWLGWSRASEPCATLFMYSTLLCCEHATAGVPSLQALHSLVKVTEWSWGPQQYSCCAAGCTRPVCLYQLVLQGTRYQCSISKHEFALQEPCMLPQLNLLLVAMAGVPVC